MKRSREWASMALSAALMLAGAALAVRVSADTSAVYTYAGIGAGPAAFTAVAIAAMIAVWLIKPNMAGRWPYVMYAAILAASVYLAARQSDYPGAYNTVYVWGDLGIRGADILLLSVFPLTMMFYKLRPGTVKHVSALGLLMSPILLAAAFLHIRFYGTLIALTLTITMTIAIGSQKIWIGQKRWFALLGIPLLAYIAVMGFGLDTGYEAVVSERWLTSAKWLGSADITAGTENILHSAASTYALVGFAAKFGIIPAIAAVAGVALLIIRLYRAVFEKGREAGFVLPLAACNVLAIRFVLGILNNLNLVSAVSVRVPFISWGGSAVILDAVCVGVVLSAIRAERLRREDRRRELCSDVK